MADILIVDDEQSISWGLSKLAEEMGHVSRTAASAEEGFQLAQAQRPDLIILDVRLPGMDGLTAMHEFRERIGPVPIIIITAYGELDTAVKAVRGGAFDYLTKPFELEVAQRSISRALQLADSTEVTPKEFSPDKEEIVGTSPAMQEVFKRIALVAASDACVHLRGESGTGKELVARAIHRYSHRANKPFLPIHVASLSPSLIESELFGHMQGAFTGADQSRVGLLEQADGGTIFLDEVAEIPGSIQVKLLRALELKEITPVGSAESIPADFRIISATHQNLAERVTEGSFRHDLYFRLVTFEIEIPPLRERREDIRALVEYFLTRLTSASEESPPAISGEAMVMLEQLPWYGNVRELRNAVEHGLVMARGGSVNSDHLPPPLSDSLVAPAGEKEGIADLIRQWTTQRLASPEESGELYKDLLETIEPPFLEIVMQHFQGQCATAARSLGLHRTTLRKKLDQFGISES